MTPGSSTVVVPRTPRPTAASDEELAVLLLRSANADRHAFTRLYDATAARVHGLALRVLRDPDLAEEVAQDSYLHAWLHASRFDPSRGSAVTWLLMIVHGRAVSRVRAVESGSRRDWDFGLVHAPSHPVDADATSDAAHASYESGRLRVALGGLSPGQREAIGLVYFGGLTHTEAASRTGLPLGTVKARIRSALARLARDLG